MAGLTNSKSPSDVSNNLTKDTLFGAAVLKLTFTRRDMLNTPGFTFVYNGTLRELGVTDTQVDRYIKKHRETLIAHIEQSEQK